jgi:hypothetical protein
MCEEDASDRLAKRGITATKLYLVFLIGGIPIATFFGILKIGTLELNELGDFLAGAFGPLAIFWLVLGFFQQGQELRNSATALQLQAKELANSVDQQRALVEAAREQLSQEREIIQSREIARKRQIQPNFIINLVLDKQMRISRTSFHFVISNTGGNASKLSASAFSEGAQLCTIDETYVPCGWEKTLPLFLPQGQPTKIIGTISYLDGDGDAQSLPFVFVPTFLANGQNALAVKWLPNT